MRRFVVVACTILSLALATTAVAQAVPGNAPGSQTGDGAGAFTGLASSPEANLFTGVAQTSIPIEVPPGRLGTAPVLALSYSSNAGPSAYGNGWGLPLPRIHRSTRNGVPNYDQTDGFVLEMPGSVVELERVPGSLYGFRAEIESAFLRIGFEEEHNRWKVVDKFGVAFVFGPTALSRTGRGPAREQTFAWLLHSVEDPAGNRVEYEYRAGGQGGTSAGLPSVIRYGANVRAGLNHFAAVSFFWTSLQHTSRVSYRDGYPDRLDVRLEAIETSTHDLPARRYDFSHEEDPVSADLRLVGATLTAFAENAVDDVQLPSTVFVYAPTVHQGWPSYGDPGPGPQPYEIPLGGHLRLGGNVITADSLDLNGDSRVDRLDTVSQPPRVQLGIPGNFGAMRAWNWPSGNTTPRSIRKSDNDGNLIHNVFDLDGDGFADLVDSNGADCSAPSGTWCLWKGSTDGFSATVQFWNSPVLRLRSTENGGAKVVTDLIDLNGDGRLDLVDSRGFDEAAGVREWKVYRNIGTGFAATAAVFPAPLRSLSRTNGGRALHGLLDLNADSLPDLVVADSDSPDNQLLWGGYAAWQVYLNDGSRFASTPDLWPIEGGPGDGPGLPNFLSLHASDGSTTADLFDITGDGRPDLVRRSLAPELYVDGLPGICRQNSSCFNPDDDYSAISRGLCCFRLYVFVNTGSSFSQPVGWSAPAHGLRSDRDTCPYGTTGFSCGMPLVFDFDYFDVDGDGLVDFVERFTAGGKPGSWLVHPHPASAKGGGARPNALLAMRNGIGGETMLRYGTAADTPDTRLPFPHWVVEERELRDSVFDTPPLRSSFAYRGGWFDPVDRELRGFALVQETDPVGSVRVREYHQDRRRSGRLRRVTNLAPSPCVPADPSNSGDPCSPWQFPLGVTDYTWPEQGAVLLSRESDVPLHNRVPVENLRRTTDYLYDSYGNVTQRRVATAMAATTTTTTNYVIRVADGPGGVPLTYLVAKPSRVVTSEAGTAVPLLERTFEYEWKDPAPASMLAASTCVRWNGSACSHWSRRSFEYDAAGNATAARAPDGARSRTDYDSNALFAIRSVDPLGHVTESTTEPKTGMVTETIAPGGNILRSRYDGLGRLLKNWGPGTTKSSPLRSFEYAPGSLSGTRPRVIANDASSGRSATFFDGHGRPAANKSSSVESGVRVSVVSGLQRRDERGLVVAEALPFPSSNANVGALTERFEDASAWLEFAYDDAGRLSETRSPDGAVTRVDRTAPGVLRTEDANFTGQGFSGALTLELFDGHGHRLLREHCDVAPSASAPFECPENLLLRRQSWIWDGLGRVMEERTDALGQAAGDSVTRVERDGLGTRTSVFHSNTGTWRYENDDNGRVVAVTKPDGVRLTTTYDAAGRILRRRGPGGSAIYRYQSRGGGLGKVKRAVSRSRKAKVSEDFSYDDRGRVVARRRRISVRRFKRADLSTAYHYDDLDRRVATEYIGWNSDGGGVVTTEFDELGRPGRIASEGETFVSGVDYDWAGRPTRIDYGNGTSDLSGYDEFRNETGAAGRLRCIRTTLTPSAASDACDTASSDLDALHYAAYDPVGNLLEVVDPLRPLGDPLADNRRFVYDSLGRLVSAATNQDPGQPYAFDPLGNLTLRGSLALEYGDPAHPSQLTATRELSSSPVVVEHDEVGRRQRDGEREFFYDDADRLTEAHVGGVVASLFGYSDAGERIYARHPGSGEFSFELGDGIRIDQDGVERTIFFGGRAVAVERFAAGTPHSLATVNQQSTNAPTASSRSTSAGGIRSISPATTRVYLHTDHQQSVRMVTDQTGVPIEHHRYLPFGQRRRLASVSGTPIDTQSSQSPYAYNGQREDRDAELIFFGARHYDPATGSFLTLDPAMQFASPYAYSDGNPILGRDADGKFFGLTAIDLAMIAVGTASFVDSIVRTGDLGHSLTAGIYAGFSVYASSQLSTMVARPLARSGYTWLQVTASVASDGFGAISAAEAIEDGRYVGGIVQAGMLAASLIGIETANDPGYGGTPAEAQERHGVVDRGMIDGRQVIDVNGICATRPGCLSNTLVAMRENIQILFGAKANCVGGCEQVAALTSEHLGDKKDVLLRCNSFGSIKCLGALGKGTFTTNLAAEPGSGIPSLKVEMSGAPLLRPPVITNTTYQVNLFDPVVWVGSGYSTPLRSDVVLGRNWWVPTPVLVHHTSMYEKPFFEALGEVLQ